MCKNFAPILVKKLHKNGGKCPDSRKILLQKLGQPILIEQIKSKSNGNSRTIKHDIIYLLEPYGGDYRTAGSTMGVYNRKSKDLGLAHGHVLLPWIRLI